MKCPQCGQWNKASLPRCFFCGADLNQQATPVPSWKDELVDGKSKVYIRVDEDGDAQAAPDDREVLAREMADLKLRKVYGEKQQRRLREEGAKRGYAPSALTVKTHTTRETFFSQNDDPAATLRRPKKEIAAPSKQTLLRDAEETMRFQPAAISEEQQIKDAPQIYDSLNDTSSFEPLWDEMGGSTNYVRPQDMTHRHIPVRRMGFRRLLKALLILCIVALIGLGAVFGIRYVKNRQEDAAAARTASILTSTVNELPAHMILIPGDDGDLIYISELYKSYEVTGGFATIEIADHIWYDNYEDYLQETMEVTLTPFLKSTSGRQTPMDTITFDIDIPLSPVELITPDTNRIEISTAMYTMKFRVPENSTVTVNGEDLTDMVNQEGGDVTYNATIQPIGDNEFTIKVRSQYCRESTTKIVIYRAQQEIPLDLATDIAAKSTKKSMQISATTLPGANVNVVTPHTDLNIDETDSNGSFSFYAVFDRIGTNTITITADYPGKKQSIINYDVYYVPPPSEYTTGSCWPMNATNYAELLSNNATRVKNTQRYVCVGTIEYFVSEKPQMAVLNIDTTDSSMLVLLENSSSTTWEVGQHYSIYADAYGMYNDMPRLTARYTYK